MRSSDLILFLDLETSHLDPERGRILELGAILTDANLTELGRWASLFPRPPSVEMLSTVDMHRTSGLLAALEQVSRPAPIDDPPVAFYSAALSEFERTLLRDLVDVHAVERLRLQLAGYSIHYDRSWLRGHMPTLDGWLSHRMIDVSTIRELTRRWRPAAEPTDRVQAKHRALADCEAARRALGRYRDMLWPAPADTPHLECPICVVVAGGGS